MTQNKPDIEIIEEALERLEAVMGGSSLIKFAKKEFTQNHLGSMKAAVQRIKDGVPEGLREDLQERECPEGNNEIITPVCKAAAHLLKITGGNDETE